jgi:hypothetical protein
MNMKDLQIELDGCRMMAERMAKNPKSGGLGRDNKVPELILKLETLVRNLSLYCIELKKGKQ